VTELLNKFSTFPWIWVSGSKVDTFIVSSSVIIVLSAFSLVEFVESLELACGTGLVGQALGEKGFRNIYGCDISEKMLEIAETKNIYRSLDQFELGQEDFIGTFPIPYK
jgi:predicted TPR repeat methyltransferase